MIRKFRIGRDKELLAINLWWTVHSFLVDGNHAFRLNRIGVLILNFING